MCGESRDFVMLCMQKEERAPLQGIGVNPSNTDGGPDEAAPIITTSSDDVVPLQTVAAKRPTRQWAAWTREEEECFFTALRQVGKNFEKITCRVQSKNKDQVRHYYYRLVRRMNKLLGPDLCLDAKNTKDTNAAMLRWWSLLEKYSCKASKLHLKPRRFKIFLEALEHQLLKDRKKCVRKRSSQGENSSSPPLNKSPVNDSRAVKIVVVEGQNVQKAGNGKRSLRHNSNLGVARSSHKGDCSPTKSTRQRRKTAAIKRWEKAAMAGVSLVADAAEHVERIASGKEADPLGGLAVLSVQAEGCSMEQNDPGPSNQVHANSLTKLKLQLFPIDDDTRKALESDKHNPHLELTLSSRKKISSVLEHLDRKWGSSSAAAGELILFPFDIQRDNLLRYQRWTQDSVLTAAEVYAMIGSPTLFRLRYGWITSNELQSATPERPIAVASDSCVHCIEELQATAELAVLPAKKMDEMGKLVSHSAGGHQITRKKINAPVHDEAYTLENVDNNHLEPTSMPFQRDASCDGSTFRKNENAVCHMKHTPGISAGEWADSLTNVSVGDLLTDVTDDVNGSCVEAPLFRSLHSLEAPFTCDSFDAAIAAHISSHSKSSLSGESHHASSIWDAEETCDEFSFQKRAVANKQNMKSTLVAVSFGGDGITSTSSAGTNTKLQVSQIEAIAEDASEYQMDECRSEPCEKDASIKDFSSLTDIYWPDSLGPLELDVSSCKYYSEDVILSDSLSGLNRLIASSLDAFQHCPLFALDDKGPSQAAATHTSASFAGKINTGDAAEVRSLQV